MAVGKTSTDTTHRVVPRRLLSFLLAQSDRFFVRVTYGRNSVLLCRRGDTFCTSGCTGDVIFGHSSKVAQRRRPAERQCTRSLGPGYKLCAVIPVAGRRTRGTTFRALKVTSQVATQVSTWMYDRLRAGIPSRYASQLGQLTLASLRGRLIEYQLRLG